MDMGAVEVGETETLDARATERRVHAGLGRQPARGHPRASQRGTTCCGSARSSRTHERFPERTNVQLVRVEGPHDIHVGVWERGAGETLSSGTSSVAAAAAAVSNGWCESPVDVHLAGGDLEVELAAGPRRSTGAAQEICLVELSRGIRAVKFSKRLDQVPPYLFAELERKISVHAGGGDRRDQPRHRRPRPAHPGAGDRCGGARAARPGHPRLPDEPRHPRVPRGRRGLLPRPFRRRSRGGGRDRPGLGGKEGVATWRSSASIPAICLAPDPATRRIRPGRFRRLRAVLPSAARGERLPSRPRLDPGRRCSAARTSSSSTIRTTRPARSCRTATSTRAVEFARANDLIVVHDSAYSEICFEGYRAPSFLETPARRRSASRSSRSPRDGT